MKEEWGLIEYAPAYLGRRIASLCQACRTAVNSFEMKRARTKPWKGNAMTISAPAQWRVILAFVFDLITSFAVFCYIVAVFTGSIIDDGFFLEVEGAPALIAFVLIVAYFILVPRFFGGRVWHRILRAKPRRRSTRARC
jgi:hypothetical protein